MVILLIIMYIILAGFSPAVLRAGISAVILAIFRIFNIRTNIRYYLTLSVALLFIIFPYMVTDIGIYLSIGGVIGLIIADKLIKIINYYFRNKKSNSNKNKYLDKIIIYVRDLVITTIVVQIIISRYFSIQF